MPYVSQLQITAKRCAQPADRPSTFAEVVIVHQSFRKFKSTIKAIKINNKRSKAVDCCNVPEWGRSVLYLRGEHSDADNRIMTIKNSDLLEMSTLVHHTSNMVNEKKVELGRYNPMARRWEYVERTDGIMRVTEEYFAIGDDGDSDDDDIDWDDLDDETED